MSNIIAFTSDAPSYLTDPNVDLSVNDDVSTYSGFPALSILGKKFSIVRDKARTVVLRPGGEEGETAQFIELAVLRANPDARSFYAKAYGADEGEAVPPDCYSMDGITPSAGAAKPQATACATCPNNVWGDTPNGKGTKCRASIRMAVAAPDNLEDPMLLRAPPASMKAFREIVSIAKKRKIPFTAIVLRVGFDVEAESPVLTFKPVGFLPAKEFAVSREMYSSELVQTIVGTIEPRPSKRAVSEAEAEFDQLQATGATPPAGEPSEEDMDKLAGKAPAKAEAKPKAKPKAEPKPDPKPEPKVEVKAQEAEVAETAKALGIDSVDDLLASFDD